MRIQAGLGVVSRHDSKGQGLRYIHYKARINFRADLSSCIVNRVALMRECMMRARFDWVHELSPVSGRVTGRHLVWNV